MTRERYLELLRVQGQIWAEYTYHNDWMNIPFWALDALHYYLTRKVAP